MKQKWEIIFCGVGGQGLLLDGNLLGAAASIIEKRQAVMTCAYGTETRGTFTKSDLILSDEYIDFPEVLHANVVVALAQVAYDRYINTIQEGSILLYNANLIVEAPSKARQYGMMMEDLAIKAGSPGSVNIIALGALIGITSCAKPDSVKEAIKTRFAGKEKVTQVNLEAFDLGLDVAQKMVPEGV